MKCFVRLVTVFSLALSLVCLGLSGTANAIPNLQLDIGGGEYDPVTETTLATTNPFNLYAFATPGGNVDDADILGGTFMLSVAITPPLDEGPVVDYGSFSIGGTTFNVTADMDFGVPPLEEFLANESLPTHGIFDTYYTQIAVDFVAGQQFNPYDVQPSATNPDVDPDTLAAGSGMYYDMFTVDLAKLNPDYTLHFDLYALKENGAGKMVLDYFAPFSHDAEGPPVPEPATLLLVGSGLAALVMYRRRQDRK